MQFLGVFEDNRATFGETKRSRYSVQTLGSNNYALPGNNNERYGSRAPITYGVVVLWRRTVHKAQPTTDCYPLVGLGNGTSPNQCLGAGVSCTNLRVWGQNLRRCERLGVRLTWLVGNLPLRNRYVFDYEGRWGRFRIPFTYCTVL